MSVINRLREGIIAFILIAVLVVISSNKSYSLTYCSNCREADSLAMVALYHATDGPHWTNNTNWLVPGQPLENWYGLTFSGGRVMMLNLTSNNLNGYIPFEIANMTSLRYLMLNSNLLGGMIPSSLASLSSVRIYIDNNLFDFGDIANSTIPSTNTRFFYYPQEFQPAPVMMKSGNSITLNVQDRFSGNQYFWYNNDAIIEGAGSYEYTFTPGSTSKIFVEIKNNLYPGLTLITKEIIIEIAAPELIITNPEPVCSPLTVDITGAEITQGSTAGLEFTYFRDANASDQMTLEEAQAIAVSGTYYIKGTNDGGQSDIKPVEVVVNSNPEVSGLVYDVTCAGGDNGSVDITVIGGKAPYTFNWSTGLQEEDLNNISEGSYQVTVADANNCSATSTFVVNQNDSELPIVNTKDVVLQLDETGNASLTAEDLNNGSTDNCGIASIAVSKTEFSSENTGDNNITLTITDASGNVSTGDAVVKVIDLIAPSITAPASVSITVKEGEVPVVELGTPVTSDNCGIKEVTNDAPQAFAEGLTVVTWSVTDNSDNVATAVQEVTITIQHNELPQILSLTSNTPVELGEATEMEAEFSDDNLKSATFDWGDGATTNGNIVGQKIYGTHVYAEEGEYSVTLSIVDEAGETASMEYVNTVVDNTSSGGHITGGGWINSAGGDYKQSKRCDKGNFGFEVQSDKKRGIRGNFTFNLHNTNFRVRSNNIDWLTINDDHALFAGSAVVNGHSGYEFMVSAVDVDMNKRCRDNDLLRLMVWDGRGNLIYDNQQGSGNMERPVNQIGNGSIVIHKQKDIYCQNFKSASISEEEVSPIETSLFENIKAYPNPAVNVLNIELPGREEEIISYDIFDVTGRVITSNRSLEVWGQNSWIDLEELGIEQGMYVLKLKGGDKSEVGVVRFMKE